MSELPQTPRKVSRVKTECCRLSRGRVVVVLCCTCVTEGRPRRKVVALGRPGTASKQQMIRLDKGVVVQICDRAPGETKMPRAEVWVGRDNVHLPTCSTVTGDA